MEWVDRLAAELHLEALSAHERDHLAVGVPRGGAPGRAEGHAAAMYVVGLGRGTEWRPQARRRDRGRDPRAPAAAPTGTRGRPTNPQPVIGGRLDA